MEEITTEQRILEAAEAEFLEKGYSKTRTTEIAKRAGVNHAMLHYYFRTKEKLFDMIFQKKVNLMSEILLFNSKQGLPFLDKIKKIVEDHFDFIASNANLPNFIFSEITKDEKLKSLFINAVKEKASTIIINLEKEIQEETSKGTIRSINPYDLILTIASLNIFTFISFPLISEVFSLDKSGFDAFLQHRKEENVKVILHYLTK